MTVQFTLLETSFGEGVERISTITNTAGRIENFAINRENLCIHAF